GAVALIAGDIISGNIIEVMYDGTQWQLLSGASVNNVPFGGTGVVTLTGLAKGNGTAAFSAAVHGTDYMSPNDVQNMSASYVATTGSANAYVAAFTPA